jgi:hypothetical protein
LEDLIANNAKDVEIQVSHAYMNISFEDFVFPLFFSIGRLGIFSSRVILLSLFLTKFIFFWTCVQSVIAEVPDILLRCVSRDEAALAVTQKVILLL